MEYNAEPGIDGRTHFLFIINGNARGISLRELLKEKIPLNEWTTIDGLFDELSVYTDGNHFVPVESVFCREALPDEEFVEIRMDNSRDVVVTHDYSCIVMDENKKHIVAKKALSLKRQESIPMHKLVQCLLPWDYYKKIKEDSFTRRSEPENLTWADYVALKPRSLSVIHGNQKTVFSEENKRGKKMPAYVKYTGSKKPVPLIEDMKIFRLRLKSCKRLPKLIAACGILLYC